MHRCQCLCLCQRSSVISVVREALAPGYPSGVCLPLHFAMFISVAAPVHALSSCWETCAFGGLLLSTGAEIPPCLW